MYTTEQLLEAHRSTTFRIAVTLRFQNFSFREAYKAIFGKYPKPRASDSQYN